MDASRRPEKSRPLTIGAKADILSRKRFAGRDINFGGRFGKYLTRLANRIFEKALENGRNWED
jgi:hypothetical protein